MKTMITVLLMIVSTLVLAQEYTLIPNQNTEDNCIELGLVGTFIIQKDSNSSGYFLVFNDSNVNTYVTSKNNVIYKTFFKLVFGGFGRKEIILNLKSNTFSYKNDLTYDGQAYSIDKCIGKVQY